MNALVWQHMNRSLFARWAWKHQHGKLKYTSMLADRLHAPAGTRLRCHIHVDQPESSGVCAASVVARQLHEQRNEEISLLKQRFKLGRNVRALPPPETPIHARFPAQWPSRRPAAVRQYVGDGTAGIYTSANGVPPMERSISGRTSPEN